MPLPLDHRSTIPPDKGRLPSPDPSTLPEERRQAARAATVFTIGKITVGDRSWPCMVRDMSEGGMRIQMATPPAMGSGLLVEMRGLEPRFARVRWVSGRDAGLAFDIRCSLAEVFAARSNKSGQKARQPRFALRRTVGFIVDDVPVTAEIADISVGGAKLMVTEGVRQGRRGVLSLNLGLAQDHIAGEICWVGEGQCGFRFALPISSVLLATILEAER